MALGTFFVERVVCGVCAYLGHSTFCCIRVVIIVVLVEKEQQGFVSRLTDFAAQRASLFRQGSFYTETKPCLVAVPKRISTTTSPLLPVRMMT